MHEYDYDYYIPATRAGTSTSLTRPDLPPVLSLYSLSAREWLAAPPRNAHLVELVAAQAFPQHSAACRQFLRHRSILLAPQTLATNGVPLCSLMQPQPSPFP